MAHLSPSVDRDRRPWEDHSKSYLKHCYAHNIDLRIVGLRPRESMCPTTLYLQTLVKPKFRYADFPETSPGGEVSGKSA